MVHFNCYYIHKYENKMTGTTLVLLNTSLTFLHSEITTRFTEHSLKKSHRKQLKLSIWSHSLVSKEQLSNNDINATIQQEIMGFTLTGTAIFCNVCINCAFNQQPFILKLEKCIVLGLKNIHKYISISIKIAKQRCINNNNVKKIQKSRKNGSAYQLSDIKIIGNVMVIKTNISKCLLM